MNGYAPKVVAAEPPEGRSSPRYAAADLLDCYAVNLPPQAPDDARKLARLVFRDQPRAVRGLMTLRDAIMTRFGVKTSDEIRSEESTRGHIDFFPVVAESSDEVEMGADDKHLDFRAWVTLDNDGGQRRLRLTTAVRVHNLLGRSYLLAILPFHVFIVRSLLRRLALRAH
jgi:hypothetical protein